MSLSDPWITDGFEQSSEDVWSNSTGQFMGPDDFEKESPRTVTEFDSVIKEVQSSIASKQSRSTLSERQKWERVARLAESKLKGIERHERTQEWLSTPAEVGTRQTGCGTGLHRQAHDPEFLNHVQQQEDIRTPATSRSSKQIDQASFVLARSGPQSPVAKKQFSNTGIRSQNTSHLSSEDLYQDSSLGTNSNNEHLLQIPAPNAEIESHVTRGQNNDALSPILQGLGSHISDQTFDATRSRALWDGMRADVPREHQRNDGYTGIDGPSQTLKTPALSRPNFQQVAGRIRNHVKNPGNNRSKILLGDCSHSRGTSGEHQPILNVQVPLLADLGDDTAEVRLRRGRPSERGASCAYCTLRKKRCSGDVPCDACRKSRLYRALCVPANFKESRILPRTLYDSRIKTLLDNVLTWLPNNTISDPVSIKISNGFMAQFEVELRPYIPFNEDALTHVLFRGLGGGMIPPRAKSTAFALLPNTLPSEKIDEYCDSLVGLLISKEASEHHTLANHVLVFAMNQCQLPAEQQLPGLDMVKLALRFWAIQAVFFKSQWTIMEGASRVGMSPLTFPGFWYGVTLLPRLVNQELDRAFEKRMDEIEKELLEQLQNAVFKNHRALWCSIFLTCFTVLHSLEKDSWNLHAWEVEASRRGGTPWPLKRRPSVYYTQNQHIADVVSSHFRVVDKGHTPFTIDWGKETNQQLLHHNLAAHQFVASIQYEIGRPDSNYRQQVTGAKEFNRDDITSLNYLYTRKLVIE